MNFPEAAHMGEKSAVVLAGTRQTVLQVARTWIQTTYCGVLGVAKDQTRAKEQENQVNIRGQTGEASSWGVSSIVVVDTQHICGQIFELRSVRANIRRCVNTIGFAACVTSDNSAPEEP